MTTLNKYNQQAKHFLFSKMLLLFFLSFMNLCVLRADDHQVDSLYQLIEQTDDIEEKVEHYHQLLLFLYKNNSPKLMTSIKELIALSQKENSISGEASAASFLGVYNQKNGNWEAAIDNYTQALEGFKLSNQKLRAVNVCNSLTNCNMALGKQKEAMLFVNEGIAIAEKETDEELRTLAYDNKSSYLHMIGEYKEALDYYDKSIKVYRKLNDKERLCRILSEKSLILLYLQDTALIEISTEAINLALEINHIALAQYAMVPLGYFYLNTGKYKEAIKLSNEQLKLANETNSYNDKLRVYRFLGDIYSDLDDEEKVLESYYKCIELSKEKKDTINWQYTNANLGFFLVANQPQKAKIHLEESLYYFKRTPEVILTLQILSNLSKCYFQENDLEKAKQCIDEGIALNNNQNISQVHVFNILLGEYLIKKNNYAKAKRYLKEAFTYAQQNDNQEILKNSTLLLYQANKKTGQFLEALTWYEKHQVLADSVSGAANARKMTTLLLETEFDKEKEVLVFEQAKQEAILKAETKQSRIIAIGIGLLALLGFGFFWNARRKNQIIAKAKNQLEQLNNTKDRIFAIIGHDLRKPVIAFNGISETINYLIQKEDYSTLKQLGAEIEQDGFSMQKLTDNLLNWALMQRDVMPHKPQMVALSPKVEEVFAIFEKVANAKDIELNHAIPADMEVYADSNALLTILVNLTDNALKYTPQGGQVTIEGITTQEGIKINIMDNGVGMAAEQLHDIFLLQKDKSKKGTEGEKGTGLGLYLVNELVKMNSGNIEAKSEVGKGTTFEMRLPKRKVAA